MRRSRAALHLAFELPALDEGVDQPQHLPFLVRLELLDREQSPAQPAVALLLGQAPLGRAVAVEVVDRNAQGLGDGRQQLCRQGDVRALLVSNHALRDSEFGSELHLGGGSSRTN